MNQLFFLKKIGITLAVIFILNLQLACSGNIFDGMETGDSSNDAEELVTSGNARLLAKDNEGALKAFNQALAIKQNYPPALRGKVSALLNIASPSGSFAADFSQLIVSQGGSAEDLSETLNFSLTSWEAIAAAAASCNTLLKLIPAADQTETDKLNLSIISMTTVIAKIMVTTAKLEAIAPGTAGLNSDFSNIGDFIDFANTDCVATPADPACTTSKITGDDALALLDDAIASGELPISIDTGGEDLSGTLTDQLEALRCELCFPATPVGGYVQPSNCGLLADHPECS